MQCIPCGQYILADRFLRNNGNLVESEVFSTFGCQFPSKRSFEKSKNTKVCLYLFLKWQCLDHFCHKNQPSGYLVEHEALSTFGVSFLPKEVLRNLKIQKFA